MTAVAQISLPDAVVLGATDSLFYSRFFFPRTVRQESPDFHRDVWARLEEPGQRYVGLKIYRDGAKTSLARLFLSKRIAYGVSHTILAVSKAEAHAVRTVRWIKRQVQYNTLWATAFQLRQGGKWSESEAEIIHGVDEYPIYLVAAGMTGQIRGINLDDFRPDLILGDDVDDEESAGSKEQREKHSSLFFGSLMQTLAAPTEASDPRGILLQTPLDAEDIINTCEKDPRWNVVAYSCFDNKGESTWPSKFPTEFLLQEKDSYIKRNQLHVWMREKEVTIVSTALSSFRVEWLKPLDLLPANCRFYIAIDPASSEAADAAEFAMVLLAFWGKNVAVWREKAARAIMPDEACVTIFEWIRSFPVQGIVVETVQYQKILAWYIEQEMHKQRTYRPVHKLDDKRAKDDVILQSITSVAPFGNLYYHPSCHKFLQQFTYWRPGTKGVLVDVIDATSKGIFFASKGYIYDGEYEDVTDDEEDYKPLEVEEVCP